MPAKTFFRTLAVTSVPIALLAVVGAVLTRYWVNPVPQPTAAKGKPPAAAALVDEQPLITARRLAALATTPEEQEFAQNALRVADHEVDLVFATALRDATRHPAAVPAAARPILAHLQIIQDRVNAEQKELSRLKQLLAKSDESRKLDLEEEIQLQEATLEVDQEDLDAARQELIRAGGDPRSTIQQLLDQHEAWGHQHSASSNSQPATQQGESRTVIVQIRAWRQLAAKAKELEAAREEVKVRQAQLAREHKILEQEARGENPEEAKGREQPSSSSPAPGATAATSQSAPSSDLYSILKEVAEEQKSLAELDKRAADLQELDAVYSQWDALVQEREHAYLMGVIEGVSWIVVLVLSVVLADRLLRAIVARLAPESGRRHTIRIAARFAVQVIGVALILVVLFGPPSQLATVLALAGAGLTVALKDFIVGFFGWFILMGPNGIRPGDWVEINGIAGEVVEVGPLHTVILETGNWSDAGHPTGRKVTVVNSFAIEGHYFNFSTTGQWLWDEIEVPIPAGVDPYPIAEAVHKIVVAETQANMRLADQEWQRAVPGHVGRTFAPAPAIMVRPTTLGVNVIVRYITRAHERHELRSRLFHKIVDLLRSSQIAAPALETSAAKTAAAE